MTLLAPPWNDLVRVPENRSAVRAVWQLGRALEQSRRVVSPLLLHGLPGTGKTTLVDALVQAVTESPLGHTVQIVAANDLDSRPQEGEDDGTYPELAECDLLIVEDVQHLPPRSADLVGRVLDLRTRSRRPTVFTAHAGPAALLNVPRRLASRLSAGLVVPLEAFSPKSRLKLLRFHADRLKIKLTADALRWIADQPAGGFRPLLGMLQTLRGPARKSMTALTREQVANLLANDARPPAVADIVAAVAASFGVSPKELLGTSRLKTVMLARQTAIYLARTASKLSLPAVGREFGRDHSTVLHAVRKVEELLTKDADYAGTVKGLRTEISG
ncbi:DnaA/Hda family protein [Limnoglobus roseus]|uniref:Chromosomal replication initiator protein DnaA n=1 Tax=Limnoglobus roseus TaxID=2598579 RepID=A0A5C1A7R4_9BACT|nr:helix-turn-helix domain-containing protein [Limnoglobus roseus]QEL14525.1 chromosomal replication initiator protein DnaA [Limnoglobus roseus]